MNKILNFVLIFITAVMTVISGTLIYYKTFGKDKIPSAITSTYATTITDPMSGEELPAIQANYYANKNGKGHEVIELLFNCYSGVAKQAVYARGFQLVKENDEWKLYRYDKYDGVSFETGHEYNWGDKMIIDIDGKTYAVALDGKYTTYTAKLDTAKAVGACFTFGLSLLFYDSPALFKAVPVVKNYTFEDLLLKVGSIIKSCSNGTGDSVISLIDLGDFLHIYNVDENGQISAEPIGNDTFINSYFTMATHYDYRGMVWSKQSIFESVAYDNDFNESGLTDETDYWQAHTVITLTENDFESRYVSAESGYYYALSTEKINEIKNFDNVDVDIVFNISNFPEVNVLGFDYYALYGIKVNSLTIKSNTAKEFKLLVNSLKDTGLTEIITENVSITNINSGVVL